MKNAFLVAIPVILASALTGCMSNPLKVEKKTTPITDNNPVTMIIPVNEDDVNKTPSELLKGYTRVINKSFSRNHVSSTSISIDGDKFTLNKLSCLRGNGIEGICNRFSWAKGKLEGSLSSEPNTDNSKKIVFNPTTFSKEYNDSNFNVQLSSNAIVNFISNKVTSERIELDSTYPADSVYANFKRLAKSKSWNGNGKKVDGVVYQEKFYVLIEKTRIEFFVRSYPYRDGSKVVVTAYLKPITTGTVVDYVSVKEKFIEKISSIVNS